jgi:hypothetical protein
MRNTGFRTIETAEGKERFGSDLNVGLQARRSQAKFGF